MRNIGDIKWPDDAEEAVRYYLGFVVKLLKLNSLDYSSFDSDPLLITEQYLQGLVSEEYRKSQLSMWRDYLKDNGYFRDVRTPNAIMARFAIGLFSVNKENVKKEDEMAERVSWDILFCHFLGKDTTKSDELMFSYFNI